MIIHHAKVAAAIFSMLLLTTTFAASAHAQDESPTDKSAEEHGEPPQVDRIVEDTQAHVEEFAEKVDADERAQEVSAGILKPIYALAEYLSFPAVHWVAFAVMVAGVVSFALQLVLAKLIVLAKMGFSFTSIFSDALGLLISVVGLVLTTQAAAENSNFTRSPAAVLSAAIVGLVVGFVFYWWGQSEEMQAVEGRKVKSAKEKAS